MSVYESSSLQDMQSVTQSRRHGGALVGSAPPKQSFKPPQIETWNTINQWSFG